MTWRNKQESDQVETCWPQQAFRFYSECERISLEDFEHRNDTV